MTTERHPRYALLSIVLAGRPEMAKPGNHTAGGAAGRGRFLASRADREQFVETLKWRS